MLAEKAVKLAYADDAGFTVSHQIEQVWFISCNEEIRISRNRDFKQEIVVWIG